MFGPAAPMHERGGCMKRVKAAVAVGLLAMASLSVGASGVFGAEAGAWSFDADCGSCHVNEEASGHPADDKEAGKDSAGAKDAAENGKSDKGSAETAAKDKDTSAKDKDTSAQDKDASAKDKDATQNEDALQDEETADLPLIAAHNGLLTCTMCHSDEEALEEVHEDVSDRSRKPRRLKSTSVDSGLCQGCHGDMEALAEATKESKALVDEFGTTVNPHDLPSSDLHDRLGCLSCHSAHNGLAAADSAMKTCLSCHHAEVFECYTCHE